MSRKLINKLQKRLDEIIKLDGFQELADGFEQAMNIVREHFKERPERHVNIYPELGSSVYDRGREEYGYVATRGKDGFRIAFPDGSFANFYGPEGLEKFEKEYNIVLER